MYDISIITPSLNAEKYINKCIKSIRLQKEVNVQHIVVDGGSNDSTIEIIKKNNFSEFFLLKGSSIYEALNFGVSKSRASIVGFLNTDDYYKSDSILSKIFLKFNGKDSNKIVYGDCRFVNEKGKLLYKLFSPKNISYERAKKRIFNISHPSWFVDKKLFFELGGFDTSLKFISDCDFILKALRKEVKFIYIKEEISNFLIHSNNKSNSKKAKKEYMKYFQANNGKSIIYKIDSYFLSICMYMKDMRYFFYKINNFYKIIISRSQKLFF